MTSKQKFLFLAIILLAIFFRFYEIRQMPGGLFPDESANGLDINLMQQGQFQPFYQRGNGREALFFYMEWASTAIFGKGQWQFHITSALIGVLAVVMVYFVAYRLFLMDTFAGAGFPEGGSLGEVGSRPSSDDGRASPVAISDDVRQRKKTRAIHIGLLASFLMAVSTWHVVLSRTALRANLTPLFGALTLYFLLRVYQAQSSKARNWFSVLLGLSFGLGFYTYIAYRIMAPILFMVAVWPLLAVIKNKQFKATITKYRVAFGIFFVSFCASVAWIADFFYHNFDFFIGRSGQVSIFNQSLYLVNGQQLSSKPPISVVAGVFWAVLKAAVGGFFIHGDLNWRQNISGYPFLSPLISSFFGFGLAIISVLGVAYFFAPAKRQKNWKYFLLTGWFWGMLLPELATAEGIPHGLRSAGAIAPTFIIAAVSLYVFGEWIVKLHKKIWSTKLAQQDGSAYQSIDDRHPRRYKFITGCLKLVAVCFCAALILQTYILYFVYAASSPEYFYSFRSDLTPTSQYLIRHCQQSLAAGKGSTKNSTFLVLDSYSEQTPDYLTSDPKGNFSSPCNIPYQVVDPASSWQLPPLKPGQQVVFTESTLFDARKFTANHPEAQLHLEIRNQFNQIVMGMYEAKQ